MHKFSKINDELELTHGLKSLATAYEEISVIKMQEVRGSVLANRSFLVDIGQVFANVKSSYKHQIEQLAKKTKKESGSLSTSTLPKNGKSVIVLLSANNKLYGEIIPKTFFAFLEAVKNTSSDIVIIGQLGKDLYDEQEGKKAYTYYVLPDTNVVSESLKTIIDSLIQYDNVNVFYGKFENVVSQVPEQTVVSGELLSTQNPTENFQFFFEPSLENILNFFETQIFSSLFKQTVHENQLARYASRINAMEQALGNIHTRIAHLQHAQKRADNILQNKKQLAALAGISLWSTTKKRVKR